ncbi:hypothetical protein TNCT_419391, partial [Trichonephila clavata]
MHLAIEISCGILVEGISICLCLTSCTLDHVQEIRTTSEVISATCTCPAGGTPTFCKQ